MASIKDLLFVGGNGYVRAFDCSPTKPQQNWTTNLEGTGYHPVSVLPDGNQIYAGTNGYAFRLDAKSGKIFWSKKLGCTLHSPFVSMVVNGAHLVCGVSGYVVTLDKDSGNVIWETGLPRVGYPAVMLSIIPNHILATSAGRLYCLDSLTGKLLWRNDLDGCGHRGVSVTFNPKTELIHTGAYGSVDTTSLQGVTQYHKSLKGTGFRLVHQLWIGNRWFALTRGELFALNPADGSEIWRTKIHSFFARNLSSYCPSLRNINGELWVTNAHQILRINHEDGTILQTIDLPNGLNCPLRFANLVFLNDSLFVNLAGKLYQIDPKTGNVVWTDSLEGLGYEAHFLATHDQFQDLNNGNFFGESSKLHRV